MSFENKLGESTGTYLPGSIDNSQITFMKPPEPVGAWVLYPGSPWGTVQFQMYKRPTDEQIKNTEELLGWGWVEAKK